MWLRVVKCGYGWLHLVTDYGSYGGVTGITGASGGYEWFQVAMSGNGSSRVVTGGYEWLRVIIGW